MYIEEKKINNKQYTDNSPLQLRVFSMIDIVASSTHAGNMNNSFAPFLYTVLFNETNIICFTFGFEIATVMISVEAPTSMFAAGFTISLHDSGFSPGYC